jgi:hypothetical protein
MHTAPVPHKTQQGPPITQPTEHHPTQPIHLTPTKVHGTACICARPLIPTPYNTNYQHYSAVPHHAESREEQHVHNRSTEHMHAAALLYSKAQSPPLFLSRRGPVAPRQGCTRPLHTPWPTTTPCRTKQSACPHDSGRRRKQETQSPSKTTHHDHQPQLHTHATQPRKTLEHTVIHASSSQSNKADKA